MIAKRLLTSGALIVAVCILLLVAAAQKNLQTETVLYNFGGFSGDGGLPYGGLLYHKGTLYGTTGENAPNGGSGTVFKIASTGKNYKVLYNFCSLPECGDGGEPLDLAPSLVLRGGKLYGTTSLGGGPTSSGTIFNLTLDGIEDTLYSFANTRSGSIPMAGVVSDEEGNLYGTTRLGGEGRCLFYGNFISCGTVFELTAAGEQTVLHSFGTDPDDGAFPTSGLVRDNEGNFYGTTYQGGNGCPSPFYGCGTVFEITAAGGRRFSTLSVADPAMGEIPMPLCSSISNSIFTAQPAPGVLTAVGPCSNLLRPERRRFSIVSAANRATRPTPLLGVWCLTRKAIFTARPAMAALTASAPFSN